MAAAGAGAAGGVPADARGGERAAGRGAGCVRLRGAGGGAAALVAAVWPPDGGGVPEARGGDGDAARGAGAARPRRPEILRVAEDRPRWGEDPPADARASRALL